MASEAPGIIKWGMGHSKSLRTPPFRHAPRNHDLCRPADLFDCYTNSGLHNGKGPSKSYKGHDYYLYSYTANGYS